MATVTSTALSHRGTLTGTGLVTLSGGANDTITNAQLLAMAPTSGPLFDFLSGTYADAAAAKTAFDLKFGIIILRGVSGAGVAGLAWIWTASGGVPGVQLVNAGAAGTFEVTMQLLHSTIQ